MTIRTRIAPSPTGALHIGTARTALFAYLHARHHGGDFLLRIEDTDRERSTPESVKTIFQGLGWLGIPFDGEPVFQSENIERHKEVAFEMLANGTAYQDFMSADEADVWKKANRGKAFRSPDRDLTHDEVCAKTFADLPFVVRLKVPGGDVVFNDLVKGEITTSCEHIDDLVLMRSDGTPTYNLAVVVDDHDMEITTVLRGDDHVANTPKQILIYRAMGWDVPDFGHLPLILDENGAKMSKRMGAASLTSYMEEGYLASAMRNYLLRMGWGHGDDEIISDAQAVEWFDAQDVVSAPARFDRAKLNSLNQHYIQETDNEVLASVILMRILARGVFIKPADAERLPDIIGLIKPGVNTLSQLVDELMFIFVEPHGFDEKMMARLASEEASGLLALVSSRIASIAITRTIADEVVLMNAMMHEEVMAKMGLKMKVIGPIIRGALLGHSGPSHDLGTMIAVLGRSRSIDRLLAAYRVAEAESAERA